jgi:iron complex outermembrane receptor protein
MPDFSAGVPVGPVARGVIPPARAIAIALAAAVAAGAVRAEERLPEIVVTAPPIRDESPAPEDPTAFATVVETREAATTVETLADALSSVVGVQVRRFGGLGDFSTVSIRGFSPGQVQVYLDGVPLSRSDNEVVDLSDLPLDAVERVEVYRGVTPLAFSQSGPGGVVNVVTRRPGAVPFAAGSASYGSFETRKATLAAGGAHRSFEGLVFTQYLGSAGDFEFTNRKNTPQTSDDVRETRVNNAFDQGNATVRLVYRTDPVTVSLTTDSFVKSQGIPGRATVQSQTGHRDTLRQIANLALAPAPRGPWAIALDANAYASLQEKDFRQDDLTFGRRDVENHATTVGGQVVARGAVGRHHVPGVLVASSHERFEQSDAIGTAQVAAGTSPERTRTRLTLAGQDEIVTAGDRLSIVPSVRWELYHDEFPRDPRLRTPSPSGTRTSDFVTPRLGLRGDVGFGVTLLANAGRSARIPNLTELFGNDGVVIGNPGLEPEVATSWDLGFVARRAWPDRFLTNAALEYAYFSSRIDDVIVLVPSSVNTFTPRNVSAATLDGHEVNLRLAFADRVQLTANYTHQDALDDSGDPVYDGNRLPNRPADEAYVRIDLLWSPARPLPLGAWTTRLWPGRLWYEVDLIGDNFLTRANLDRDRVDSRALLAVGLDLTLPVRGIRVALELENLTDDQTEDALGFPLPGRSVFATVSYGFDSPL